MNRFETMVENYGNLVFSVCLRITGDYYEAQDLTQDTFIAAFKALDHFEGGSEKAWLCKIATNKCLDYLKRKRPVCIDINDPQADMKDFSPPPEEEYIQNETCRQLKRLCDSLKEPYRTTALMHFVEGYGISEISEATKRSPTTVRTHIFRARKKLQKLWKEDEL